MNSNSADVIIRLIAKDEGVKKALRESGKEGAKLADKLDKVGQKGSAGLKAVDNVAKDLKSSINDLLQRTGPLGSFLKGLGPIGFAAAAGLGAVVVGAAAAARAGEDAVRNLAAIGDAADEIGLATDAYQAYTAAVKEGGIEQTALDQALRAAAKTTAEAALGTGELYSNLIQVNPEMVKQVQLADSLEDRLGAVANLYNAAGSEVERSTILLRTFGDNGIRAGKVILEHGGDVAALTSKYEALGLILSEDLIRAAQDAAGDLEIANARMEVSQNKVKLAFAGFAVDTKEKLADLFTFLAKSAGVQSLEDRISALTTEANELNLLVISQERNPIGNSGRFGQKVIAKRNARIAVILKEVEALEKEKAALEEARKVRDKEAAETAGLTSLKASLNRLREEAKTSSEREAAALKDLNDAREKGLIDSDAEFNKLRARIAEKFKDVTAIRAQETAERERAKAAAEAERALEKGRNIRAGLSDVEAKALGINQKLAAFTKDLTANMAAYGLTQKEVNQAVDDYRADLDGSAAAQKKLADALQSTLDPIARFKSETQALEALQKLANIPAEDFNRILAARAQLLTELETKEREQSEIDQFGETLEDAETRIKDSLKTASEIIDEKVAFQQKIIDALGSDISSDQATEFLKKYRKELEETAKRTDDLTKAQDRWIDLINASAGGFKNFGEVALRVLTDIIAKQAQASAQSSAGGFGGFLSSIGGGIAGALGFGSTTTAEVNHTGKAVVGSSGGARRKVPAGLFTGAPKFHSGVASLGRNEVPAILERGERVTTASDSAALVSAINTATMMAARPANDRSFGGMDVIINNFGNQEVQAEERESADGRRQLLLDIGKMSRKETEAFIKSPRGKQVMKQEFAIRPRLGNR